MRNRRTIWVAVGGLGLCITGCASSKSEKAVVMAQPGHDELPTFNRQERTIPAKVDVEDTEGLRRAPLVVIPNLAEPTPEERKILGPAAEPKRDRTVAAFYHHVPGVAEGVQPYFDPPTVALGNASRSRVGWEDARTGALLDSYSTGGARTMISLLSEARYGQTMRDRAGAGQLLFPRDIGVGLENPRRSADHERLAQYR